MSCGEGSSLSSCQLSPLAAPCFPGEQLIVSCSHTNFELSVQDFLVNMNRSRRGRALFKCSATATRYGLEMGLDHGKATILQRSASHGISMVTDKLHHKAKKGYWIKRVKVDSAWENCFLCVVQAGN